jgi:type IV pilus assembly protein PilN
VIRVNLLPQKKKAERIALEPSSSQRWLLVVLGVLLFEVIGLVLFHQTKVGELEVQQRKNAELSGQIGSIRQLVTQHEQVKRELEVLRAREGAIAKLEAARTGPTAALLELSQLLTPGKGPTVDADMISKIQKDPLKAYNTGWDTRRVWLVSFKETNRVVQVEGLARDSQDVSELALRLRASSYFYDVRLLPGKKDTAKETGMVAFGMELKVRY